MTRPRELADHHRASAELAKMAVHGAAARALVTAAIDALGRIPATGSNRVEVPAAYSLPSNRRPQ